MSDRPRRSVPIRLIAHRGASAHANANTTDAVAAARAHGATDVEIDVHQTADRQLVVTHDAIIDGSFISEMSLAEYARSIVPELAPVLLTDVVTTAVHHDLGLYLDVKQLLPNGVDEVAQVIDAAGHRRRTTFASFRADLVVDAKRRTGLPTSVLFHDPGIDLNSLVRCTGCDLVHPCFDVFPDPLAHLTPGWMTRAVRTGAGVIAWNTTDVATAVTLIALGVDGICADDPSILVRAVGRRRG